ncbi:MAG: 16S rRNA processing protein RimM [Planctomycetota bacterium]|jgi:16S rRNA processing protein RimM
MKFDLTKIGYLSKPYGFNGELKSNLEVLMLSDDFPEFIWIYLDGKPVPYCVEKATYNKSNFILKLEDVNTEEDASILKNTSIYCEQKLFKQYFEYEESLEDLVGFEVEDKVKGAIGIIESIIENAIQPTLVLNFEGKEILVPYTEEIIIDVDFDNKKVKVETPDGLIDMYLE